MMNNKRFKEKISLKNTAIHTKVGYIFLILLMIAILMLFVLLSVGTGVAGGDLRILIQTLFQQYNPSEIGRVMLEMRMPRALAACFTGASFAIAGAIMQGVTRNPLADAGLLGINAGAGFFVAVTTVLFPSIPIFGTMFSAFLGAAVAVLMVYGLGMGRHKSGTIRLILAGSAVSALLTALSQGISLTFGISKDLSFWTAGSMSGITWTQIMIIMPCIMGAALIGFLLSGKLSVLALGEESAIGLGINIRAVRLTGIAVVLVLAGASVSMVGGISFLGLIVPHSARLLVGSDYRRILPASALLGAILLVAADIAARTIHAPFDTPVGALVSAIGVPVFLALTYQKKGAAI